MTMIEVKTSELIGKALDWAVAEVEGVKTIMMSPRNGEPKQPFALFGSLALTVGGYDQSSYAPSTCWHCGGPLIEKHRIMFDLFERHYPSQWTASSRGDGWFCSSKGGTHLIAACRAIVAARLGDTVSVPAELAGGS